LLEVVHDIVRGFVCPDPYLIDLPVHLFNTLVFVRNHFCRLRADFEHIDVGNTRRVRVYDLEINELTR
jgi:hypothetical protein